MKKRERIPTSDLEYVLKTGSFDALLNKLDLAEEVLELRKANKELQERIDNLLKLQSYGRS